MSKKKTHEEYKEELISKNIVYKPIESYNGALISILHECPYEHHWKAAPANILRGRGCPECYSKKKNKTHSEYELKLIHNKISYKPVEKYIDAMTKILHECQKGHLWSATPNNILKGRGCPYCTFRNRKKTNSEYIQQLIAKNIAYQPIETYVQGNIKSLHKCPKGHEWLVKPNDILAGSGCPNCASHGFNPAKPAKLYFFSFEYNKVTYYKVGITNNTTKERHKEDWNRLKIQVLWELDFDIGAEARNLEKRILFENKQFLVNTWALKSGNTETFSVFIEPAKYNLR